MNNKAIQNYRNNSIPGRIYYVDSTASRSISIIESNNGIIRKISFNKFDFETNQKYAYIQLYIWEISDFRYNIEYAPHYNEIKTDYPYLLNYLNTTGMVFSNNIKLINKIGEKLISNPHCPCALDSTDDTICPCKDCREDNNCHCGIFNISSNNDNYAEFNRYIIEKISSSANAQINFLDYENNYIVSNNKTGEVGILIGDYNKIIIDSYVIEANSDFLKVHSEERINE